MSLNRKGRLKAALPLGLATALLCPTLLMANEDAALEMELRYIDALSNGGYANFAPAVIEAAQKKWPKAKGLLEAASIRAELRGGKQDAVLARINARPDKDSIDTWLLRLELALSYVMYGKYKEADKIYADFFKKFPKVEAEVKKAYVEAIYYYVDMLKKTDRAPEALPYYKLAMTNSPSDGMMKDFRAQYLQALLAQVEQLQKDGKGADAEKSLAEAEKIANEMVWSRDNFFGDAINGLAHAKMLRGDIAGAQEMIKDYLELLMQIHDAYKAEDPTGAKGYLRMSPLPQCRYLIGAMLYDQAKKEMAQDKPNDDKIKDYLLGERDKATKKRNGQGAFQHLTNVYINYPESQSAEMAGQYSEEIQRLILGRYGAHLKINATEEQRAKVRAQRYVEANVKFDGGDWDGAFETFSKTISQYGMNEGALTPLRKMVECAVRSGAKGGELDPVAKLKAETLTAALAEGFSGQEKNYQAAGSMLGQISTFFGESGLAAMQEKTNELFFKFYPKHAGSVAMQLKIAEEKVKNGDAAGAEKLYMQVAEATKGDAAQRDVRSKALDELISLYTPNGPLADADKEVAAAKAFAGHFEGIARPGVIAANAEMKLGTAYLHHAEALRKSVKDGSADKAIMGDYTRATKAYKALAEALKSDDNKYVTTATERKTAEAIREGVLFQQALCTQRLSTLVKGAASEKLQAAAIAGFKACIKEFPKTDTAPKALLQIGTLQAANGDIEGAQATLNQLKKDFPESAQAKNAIPLLADSLFAMGMRGEATRQYKEMFSAGGSYTPAQYLSAAERLYDAGETKLAIEACDCAMKSKGFAPYEPKVLLLRAKALLADKQVQAAYKQVSELLEKHGKKTVALDAHLLLVDVAGEEILEEKTFDGRNKLIAEAKKSVTFVTSHNKNNPTMVSRLNLAVAEVARKAYEAEVAEKSDRIEAAAGSALNAYRSAMSPGEVVNEETQQTEMLVATDPRVTEFVQKAYMGYIEVAMERANIATDAEEKKGFMMDVKDIGQEYLDTFPQGTYRTEINNAILQANIAVGA